MLALGGAAILATQVTASELSNEAANQVAGLFMQSCIRFSGDKESLRAWARQNELKELPPQAREQFLSGQPGVVFDASNPIGKFVLISPDGAGCSAIAARASGQAAVTALEDDMRRAGIVLTLVRDAPDTQESQLSLREYTASLGARRWRIVAGTLRDQQGGQAMLTANPN